MRTPLLLLLSLCLSAPALAKDEERPDAEDLSTYPNILSNDGDGMHLYLHVGGDVGPFAGLTVNTHTSFYIPHVITASLDLGLGFGSGPGGSDSNEFSWSPNPWGAVAVGYPLVNAAHHGGGRYVFSRQQISADTMRERYFDVELPTYRQLTVEGVAIHGTPNFDFDARATAFGAGIRYRVAWAAQARFNNGSSTWSPYLEHTWYLSAHVLFAQVGPTPSQSLNLPVGFNLTSAFPLFNDRDTNLNMVLGAGFFPSGGITFRFGFEWAGILL